MNAKGSVSRSSRKTQAGPKRKLTRAERQLERLAELWPRMTRLQRAMIYWLAKDLDLYNQEARQ